MFHGQFEHVKSEHNCSHKKAGLLRNSKKSAEQTQCCRTNCQRVQQCTFVFLFWFVLYFM